MSHKDMRLRSPVVLRLDKGYTQEQVANALGMKLVTYKTKEQGRADWWAHEVYALTQLYDVSADYIFLDYKCHKKTQNIS